MLDSTIFLVYKQGKKLANNGTPKWIKDVFKEVKEDVRKKEIEKERRGKEEKEKIEGKEETPFEKLKKNEFFEAAFGSG